MKLKLKKLHLENFKGIKDLEINFDDITSISGANATGKTTIFDAYSWVLWDKDSKNRKDFGIKPYELDGRTKSVDCKVTGLVEVDGKPLELCKVYKEVWTKKRGSTQETFTKNTTVHFINDVPVKKSEYNSRIEQIVSEKEFNLLSNPLYFNEILDKKERREVLLSLVKGVTKDDVIEVNESLKKLDLDNYSIDEIKAMAKASKTKINKEIESLPARIDELEKSKNTYNFESIERNKKKLEKELEDIEKALSKGSASTEIIEKNNKKIQEYLDRQREIKREIDDLNDNKRREIDKAYNDEKEAFEQRKREVKNKLEEASNEYHSKENKIKILESEIVSLDKKVQELRTRYIETNKKVFDGSLNCPTCGRPYEEHKQTEIKESFNLNKSKELEKLGAYGKELASKLEKKKDEKASIQIELEVSKRELNKINLEFEVIGEFKKEKPAFIEELVPQEYTKLQEEIDKIKEELKKLDSEDNAELIQEQKRLKNDLESINKTLGLKGQNEALNERIETYKEEEKKLAKAFEEQIEILDLCDEYLRVFTELVSEKINNLFVYVSFKLFDTQVNGALVETCEVTVDGVPFSDLNNAARINAGIDVINTLSKCLEIKVPIFIDNSESVNKLQETENQLVKLIVSEDEELKIKGE